MTNKTPTNKNTKSTKDKWKSTGGAMKPVNINTIQLVNTPKKTK